MSRRIRLALLAVAVVVVLAWLWPSGTPAPPERRTDPAAVGVPKGSRVVPELTVSCDAPSGLQDGVHDVIELVAEGGGRSTVGVVSDGSLELVVQVESGRGGIYPIGWEPGVLAWEAGRCRFLEPPRILGAVHGIVEGWRELAPHTLWVWHCAAGRADCGGLTPDADGSFFVEAPAGEPILLHTQMTGRSTWEGPEVEVVPDAERDVVVTLLPPRSAAGYGVVLEGDRSEGFVVADVLQGTAADRAQLRAGDVLVARDGRYLAAADLKPAPTRAAPIDDVQLLVRDATGHEREVILMATR